MGLGAPSPGGQLWEGILTGGARERGGDLRGCSLTVTAGFEQTLTVGNAAETAVCRGPPGSVHRADETRFICLESRTVLLVQHPDP